MSSPDQQSVPKRPQPCNLPDPNAERVTVTIDGNEISVPKGTNLIEAAQTIGIEIPHYCYHPHLSVAGNCRMCQVEVKGARKMEIACNCQVREGMEVATHLTSEAVAKAQAATLEFILINHPLDCTVCDQAGHCKLQDYHYEYNAKPSRFLESKVHKVKAEPLGPTVVLDGERCIMCSRCVRFCDEVTGTSELGLLNRGDKTVIAVNEDNVLDNPLSGTVVDLCPVGALTHREWRFNTRIWFTKQVDSVCPGCSTGCNVKVASRDGEIVQVKGRMNHDVNKEWLCDEGRYGFHRFLPEKRLRSALVNGEKVATAAAYDAAAASLGGAIESDAPLVFVSPDLLFEDYVALKGFLRKAAPEAQVVLNYKERALTEVERILVSPDYAANYQGAVFSGVVSGALEVEYRSALEQLKNSDGRRALLLVGERAIDQADVEGEEGEAVLEGLSRCGRSVALLTDEASPLVARVRHVFPARSILERQGLLVNRRMRLQYADRLIDPPREAAPVWRLLLELGVRLGHSDAVFGGKLSASASDRETTLAVLQSEERFEGLKIKDIKGSGVPLDS